MPAWLTEVLGAIGPMTSQIPAAEALASAIEAEFKSADSVGTKAVEIGQHLITFATEIEQAFTANTTPAA